MEEFTCRRKTVHWPLLFFYNMLDAVAINANIIMKKAGYRSYRKEFLTKLTLKLATPAIHTWLSRKRTRRSVHDAAAELFFFIAGS